MTDTTTDKRERPSFDAEYLAALDRRIKASDKKRAECPGCGLELEIVVRPVAVEEVLYTQYCYECDKHYEYDGMAGGVPTSKGRCAVEWIKAERRKTFREAPSCYNCSNRDGWKCPFDETPIKHHTCDYWEGE